MVGLGLFAPLPLAVMIPFMAGQSFAMGEAFGKGFQFGKRKISSMSNEEFNALSGPQAFAETTADIKAMIPSMSSAMQSFHTLQSDIIKQMIGYIAQLPADIAPTIAHQLITPVANPGGIDYVQLVQDLARQLSGAIPNVPQAFGEHTTDTGLPTTGTDPFIGPPAPPLTQQQLLDKYANWETYRQKGGLLTLQQWRVARRGEKGGIPDVGSPREEPPKQGKIQHPSYVHTLQRMLNNQKGLMNQLEPLETLDKKITQDIRDATTASLKRRLALQLRNIRRQTVSLKGQINRLQDEIRDFIKKFRP